MNAAPVSRRARPAKVPLSRDLVIETGLRILDTDGSTALTMRRVAKELDTGAASLYVYVANRDDLLTGMLDHVLSQVPVPTEGDWRARVTRLVETAIEALGRHDGLALVAFGRYPTTEHALTLIEELVTLLREGGLDPSTATWAADLIYLHIAAEAAENSGAPDSAHRADISRRSAEPPIHRFPIPLDRQTHRSDGDARARWALRALLNGIVATPVDAR
ncbi:TetR/AcrR family transcriptional regulator [Nocardia sp. NPDC058633]|uniref:TetR/AcrR family transcriptional regulator n=1 Tax=Nocardia sp. NPDC058633 TaxID=3346568 RepID=UPI00365E7C1F